MTAHTHASLFDHCVFSTQGKTARDRMRRAMHRERNERLQTSLRDFPDTAARSQDWRPGLFSRRPSGTSPPPPRDPRAGVLGYSQGVPPGLPRHSREIPGLASWAIFKASLRDFVSNTVSFDRSENIETPGRGFQSLVERGRDAAFALNADCGACNCVDFARPNP